MNEFDADSNQITVDSRQIYVDSRQVACNTGSDSLKYSYNNSKKIKNIRKEQMYETRSKETARICDGTVGHGIGNSKRKPASTGSHTQSHRE